MEKVSMADILPNGLHEKVMICSIYGYDQNTLSSWIDVTSQQLIFWEFSTHNSVILVTTFIKTGPNFALLRLFQTPGLSKSSNQLVQLLTTPLFCHRITQN